jgi:hypothetical protein
MTNDKRHQGDTKTFEELTFSEQAKAINIKIVWFLDATRSHIRKCVKEHGNIRATAVPSKVAQQLRAMADQIEAIETPGAMTVPVTIAG